MKLIGWILSCLGMFIIFVLTDGFWLPMLGIELVGLGAILWTWSWRKEKKDE